MIKSILGALGGFAVAVAVGAWAIFQSQSSTAGIGFLFLPFFGGLSGVGGWLAARYAGKNTVLLTLGLLLAIAPPAWMARGGLKTRQKNAERERIVQAERQKADAYRTDLKMLLAAQPRNETAIVTHFFETHRDDRAATLVGLESAFVDAAWLEQFSGSADMGILLMVIRNKNTQTPLLEKIWRQATYRDYFAVDLARNPRTPPEVLAEIAKGSNLMLPQALLNHPALNCAILHNLKTSIEHGYLSTENKKSNLEVISGQEPKLCPSQPH